MYLMYSFMLFFLDVTPAKVNLNRVGLDYLVQGIDLVAKNYNEPNQILVWEVGSPKFFQFRNQPFKFLAMKIWKAFFQCFQ